VDDVTAVGIIGAHHGKDGFQVVEFLTADDVLVAAHFGGHVVSPLPTDDAVVVSLLAERSVCGSVDGRSGGQVVRW
jgi:hypothetical protein